MDYLIDHACLLIPTTDVEMTYVLLFSADLRLRQDATMIFQFKHCIIGNICAVCTFACVELVTGACIYNPRMTKIVIPNNHLKYCKKGENVCFLYNW